MGVAFAAPLFGPPVISDLDIQRRLGNRIDEGPYEKWPADPGH